MAFFGILWHLLVICNGFLMFLQLYVFTTLCLLMRLLGPSWLLLGRFGPKMAPKMGPQMAPNRAKMGYFGDDPTLGSAARGL